MKILKGSFGLFSSNSKIKLYIGISKFKVTLVGVILLITHITVALAQEGKKEVVDKLKITLELKGLVVKSDLAKAEKILKDNSEMANDILLSLISNEGLNDLHDWVVWQYYNLAQKNQGIVKAINNLEELSARNPQNIGLKTSIAEGYLRIKDINKCIRLYEELNKSYPLDKEIFARLINYQMNARNFTVVIKLLEPLVKLDPKNSLYTDTLGFAYLNNNRKKDYLRLYKEIADKDSNLSVSRAKYAQVLMESGLNKEALEEWKKVLKLNSTDINAREAIAQIQNTLGNKKAAEKELAEIKKIEPNYQSAILEENVKGSN